MRSIFGESRARARPGGVFQSRIVTSKPGRLNDRRAGAIVDRDDAELVDDVSAVLVDRRR